MKKLFLLTVMVLLPVLAKAAAETPAYPPTKFPESSGWGKNIQRMMRGTHDQTDGMAPRLAAPAPLEIFDATTGQWSPASAARAELRLPAGGGKLLRVAEML